MCKKEKWRKILKDLFLIEHILKKNSLRFADAIRYKQYKIKNLNNLS